MNSHIKCFTEQWPSSTDSELFIRVSEWMEMTHFTKTWKKSLHKLEYMNRQEAWEKECNLCHIGREIGFELCLKDERFVMGWERRRL